MNFFELCISFSLLFAPLREGKKRRKKSMGVQFFLRFPLENLHKVFITKSQSQISVYVARHKSKIKFLSFNLHRGRMKKKKNYHIFY